MSAEHGKNGFHMQTKRALNTFTPVTTVWGAMDKEQPF